MPLPSLLNGAIQCQVMTKRTKLRCKNPAAFGCKSCRMHGAHKSRNVLRGENHPQYKNGERITQSDEEYRKSSIILLTLRDLGDHINLFNGYHSRGRKPRGYLKYDMEDPAQFALAVLGTLSKHS
jgi:hypothetical protein